MSRPRFYFWDRPQLPRRPSGVWPNRLEGHLPVAEWLNMRHLAVRACRFLSLKASCLKSFLRTGGLFSGAPVANCESQDFAHSCTTVR